MRGAKRHSGMPGTRRRSTVSRSATAFPVARRVTLFHLCRRACSAKGLLVHARESRFGSVALLSGAEREKHVLRGAPAGHRAESRPDIRLVGTVPGRRFKLPCEPAGTRAMNGPRIVFQDGRESLRRRSGVAATRPASGHGADRDLRRHRTCAAVELPRHTSSHAMRRTTGKGGDRDSASRAGTRRFGARFTVEIGADTGVAGGPLAARALARVPRLA